MKTFKILEDPMLPPEVGKEFYPFILVLNTNYLVSGDLVAVKDYYEYQFVIQFLPNKNKDDPGYVYTMQLVTLDKDYFVPSKFLQKNCELVHIGAVYSS